MANFRKGYKAVREEAKKQEENREKAGKKLWEFYLTEDNDEATIHFLTEEPINFDEHTIKKTVNGKERYDSVVCSGKDCEYCADGDRPSFKGAFLVFDKRPFEFTDKDGKKKKAEGQLRLFKYGTRILSQLDRFSSRYGLTTRDYIISRTGSGTATAYTFDRTDDVYEYTEAQIKNMLPEKLRDSYDGSMESLYTIIEEQLEMRMSENSNSDEDGSAVDETTKKHSASNTKVASRRVVEDEEEEEKPKAKTSVVAKKPVFKARKENSVKHLFKK